MTNYAALSAATLFLGILAAQAVAQPVAQAVAQPVAAPVAVIPTGYDMQNGCVRYSGYGNGAYAGLGNPGVSYSALWGGTGDLTDGVIAPGNWNANAVPDVGWQSEAIAAPTITSHFAGVANLGSVTLHHDDSNEAGGVLSPLGFSFRTTGGPTLTQAAIVGIGAAPASTTLAFAAGLVSDSFLMEIDNSRGRGKWAMVFEVTFTTTAVPLSAAAPLMPVGLGALGLMTRRRRGWGAIRPAGPACGSGPRKGAGRGPHPPARQPAPHADRRQEILEKPPPAAAGPPEAAHIGRAG